MAFIHEGSCECTKSELHLFSIPPTQTSMEQGSWIEYHPLTADRDGGPIEFEISGSGEDYIDFANSVLYELDRTAVSDRSQWMILNPTTLLHASLSWWNRKQI